MKNNIAENSAAVLAVPCDRPIIVSEEQLERVREQARSNKPTKEAMEETAKKGQEDVRQAGKQGWE